MSEETMIVSVASTDSIFFSEFVVLGLIHSRTVHFRNVKKALKHCMGVQRLSIRLTKLFCSTFIKTKIGLISAALSCLVFDVPERFEGGARAPF